MCRGSLGTERANRTSPSHSLRTLFSMQALWTKALQQASIPRPHLLAKLHEQSRWACFNESVAEQACT